MERTLALVAAHSMRKSYPNASWFQTKAHSIKFEFRELNLGYMYTRLDRRFGERAQNTMFSNVFQRTP